MPLSIFIGRAYRMGFLLNASRLRRETRLQRWLLLTPDS